jgi:precorrin-6B methylase 2
MAKAFATIMRSSSAMFDIFRLSRWEHRRGGMGVKVRPAIVGCLLALAVLHATHVFAQAADDSREKWEKVSEILAALRAEPGRTIADIGAGEGFYTFRIARAVAPEGRVVAVDVEEKHLDKLRDRLRQDGINNVDVVVGTTNDPRLSVEAFDAALIYNSYHEMAEGLAVLRGILNGLKHGGRLVVCEPIHEKLRRSTRAEQVKEHDIAAEYVEDDLRRTGFEIVERRPDFLPFTIPGSTGGFWLLIAVKP